MRKALSYLLGLALALLAVHPPINYDIPLMVNSFHWLYLVIVAGLLGVFLWFLNIHILLKIMATYLYFSCFYSLAPASSFNAYVLVICAFYFFLACKHADFDIIIRFIEAAFWFQLLLMVVQYAGKDTLMQFDRQEKVLFGTVFQSMRLGSLFAIMSPFLLYRSRLYAIPLLTVAYFTGALGFAFALVAGLLVYAFFKVKNKKSFALMTATGIIFGAACFYFNSEDAFHVAYTEGRLPVWWVILKTSLLDTTRNFHGYGSGLNPAVQTGPIDWPHFFFGHGLDSFLELFPFYKYDPNPFPQAHNDWLQVLWEIGATGFLIYAGYCLWLACRTIKDREPMLLCGLLIIGINKFFHFPSRMMQTVFLMVAFVAMCEQILEPRFDWCNRVAEKMLFKLRNLINAHR